MAAHATRATVVVGRAPAALGVLTARAALLVFVLACAWIAGGAANGFYLVEIPGGLNPSWVDGPLRGLSDWMGGLSPGGLSTGLIAMVGSYGAVVRGAGSVSARAAWSAIVAASLAFLLAPTLVSTDVFGYLAYARLGVLHHLNPYVHAPASAPGDAILPLVYWRDAPTPYGPLFTLGTYPVALVSPAVGLWVLKAIAAAASVAMALIVSRAASLRGRDPIAAALFVGLNPVLLFYALSGAHNDLEAMLLPTGAVALIASDRARRAGALALGGAAVKLTAGIALPFLVLGASRPRRVLFGAGVAGLLAAVFTLALFGHHVFDQLRRISGDAHYDIAFSGPDLLARLLGGPIQAQLRATCAALAGGVTIVQLLRVRAGADWVSAAGWATLALIAAISSLAPWYVVWLLPLAALGHSQALRIATLILTVYLLAVHLPALGGVPWLSGAGR